MQKKYVHITQSRFQDDKVRSRMGLFPLILQIKILRRKSQE